MRDPGARAPRTTAGWDGGDSRRIDGPRADPRRALARSTLWSDEERGAGYSAGPQPLRARWDPVPPPRSRVGQRRARSARRRSALGWFIHHYGWRAYAIPVLAALTVLAVVGIINSPGSGADTEAGGTPGQATVTIGQSVPTTVFLSGSMITTTVLQTVTGQGSAGGANDPGAGGGSAADLAAATIARAVPPIPAIDPADAFRGVVMGLLPPGEAFAKTGSGTFHIVPGTSERFGTGSKLRTFTVEVEDGISTPEADRAFADQVVAILSGPGSWADGGEFSLRRVDSGQPDFRLSLTSQMTTRQAGYCGWEVPLEASCYNQALGRVVINAARWARGSYAFNGDMASYRVYAINHEVGHALDFHHEGCTTDGGVAPVMMQQSWSTSNDDIASLNPGLGVRADGKVCRANPFAYPDRAP